VDSSKYEQHADWGMTPKAANIRTLLLTDDDPTHAEALREPLHNATDGPFILRGLVAGKTDKQLCTDLRMTSVSFARVMRDLRDKTRTTNKLSLVVCAQRQMKNCDRRGNRQEGDTRIETEQLGKLEEKHAGKIGLGLLGPLAILILAICTAWIALAPRGRNQIAPSYAASFQSLNGQEPLEILGDENKSSRRVYPYSVIPGGIESAADLRNSIARDPVVANHYKGFDVERARIAHLGKGHLLYVSYRLGARVFWSKKQLRVPSGETLVTDGEYMARTRCGNRVSETPSGPVLAVEPLFEVPEEALDLPEEAALPSGATMAMQFPLPSSAISGILTPTGSPSGPGGGIIIPPTVPVSGGGPTPPPVTTPEPELLFMLTAGLTGLLLNRKKWMRYSRRLL
jgi:hypothetical protein